MRISITTDQDNFMFLTHNMHFLYSRMMCGMAVVSSDTLGAQSTKESISSTRGTVEVNM